MKQEILVQALTELFSPAGHQADRPQNGTVPASRVRRKAWAGCRALELLEASDISSEGIYCLLNIV